MTSAACAQKHAESYADAIKKVSIDGKVAHMIMDFKQGSDPSSLKITADELEAKIRQAVGERKGPLLLIFDPQRMRLMALSDEE